LATITKRKAGWQVQIRRNGFPPLSRPISLPASYAPPTTLHDILTRYRDEVTPVKKGRKQEQSRIKIILSHPIAKRFLATLRSADFALYRDDRLQQVSGTTVIKELNLLAHAIDTARRDWSIHMDNPVRLIKRPKANRARERRLAASDGRNRSLSAWSSCGIARLAKENPAEAGSNRERGLLHQPVVHVRSVRGEGGIK
jgi:hypothetical protein